MTLKLHVFPPSPRAFKVLLVAHHLGIDYEFKRVNLPAQEQKTPSFTALNVNQRMPVLEDDGYVLWESNAIIEYLSARTPASTLLPRDDRARLQVSKWLYWESAHWDQANAVFMFENVVKALFGLGEPSESEIARGTVLYARAAKVLDSELARHSYVAGDALTLADFAIASPLRYVEQAQMPLGEFASIQRWLAAMQALPAWAAANSLQ